LDGKNIGLTDSNFSSQIFTTNSTCIEFSARAGHTLTALGDKLIACGGWVNCSQGERQLSSVEAYDPAQNKWTYLSPMRNDCASHAATGKDFSLCKKLPTKPGACWQNVIT
jgi:hypothetical protein